jgi:prepilin-type processing-associated H-X9-DG protein
MNPSMTSRTEATAGFTRSDLLAVIAGTCVLAALALPAIGSTRSRSNQEVCSDNLRTLMRATQLYADDHRDEFPMVINGGAAQTAQVIDYSSRSLNSYRPWATGALTFDTSTPNTNTAFLVDRRYAVLANYTRDAKLYKCPSDTLIHPNQRRRGWTARARSYSANMAVGRGNKVNPQAEIGAEKFFVKFSDVDRPSPANLFVFLEENQDSINDPNFAGMQTSRRWIDLPAAFHPTAGTNRSANLVFADGHVENHAWEASVLRERPDFFYSPPTIAAGDPDWSWLMDRMSYNAQPAR